MKRFVAPVIAGLCLIQLSACYSVPQTAAQGVYASKAALLVELKTMNAYGALPLCGPGVSKICHEAKILATANKASHVADDALDVAEEAARDPAIGQDAVTDTRISANAAFKAFQSITARLNVK